MKQILKILLINIIFTFYAFGEDCKKDFTSNLKNQFREIEKISKKTESLKCISELEFNKLNGLPEERLKKLMSTLSDEEVYKRLILAETLASGCSSEETAKAIAWVIRNRVNAKNAKRFGIDRDVVFKSYQFRSSTGDCDVATKSVFMCPTSLSDKDFSRYWSIVDKAFNETVKGKNPIGNSSYQYFFYKHFDHSKNCKKWKGVVPAWANASNEINSSIKLDKSCIRIFK